MLSRAGGIGRSGRHSTRPQQASIYKVRKRFLSGRAEQGGYRQPGRSEPPITGGAQAEVACLPTRKSVKG